MKRGFALLETLIALIIFSLLFIGGARLFLMLHKQEHAYQKSFQEGMRVQNVFFLLQNYLYNSFFIQTSAIGLNFYPLDLEAYHSTSFSPLVHFLTDKKLTLSYPPTHSAFLLSLPQQELYPIASAHERTLEFFKKVEGKYFLPLQKQFILSFHHSALYLNEQILLERVRDFSIKENQVWIEIKICLIQCYEYGLKKGKVYEIL
ncbi:PulJ/GspJ family protein [Helicobacter cholecystus]|uniref:PulJ/GspJ family protein n=1 Tax=Helicobacter cholecystus TaxID=45498 RepID=UPI0027387ECB|nr:prepilin-type N-terminal cleavage/methylation domain-containing protein [Helicobacter cholecystus]